MPDFSQDLKSGRTPGISDLLSAMKRNTLIGVSNSKDAGLNRKSLIKQQGFNTGFLDLNSKRGLDYYLAKRNSSVNVTAVTSAGGLIGSIKFIGYNLLGLTDADKTGFKNAFALQYGINPDLINLTFAAGSLVITFSASAVLNVGRLTRKEKAFFANADAVIRGIQPINIATYVAAANIPTSRLSITATIQIDISYTNINTSLDLVDKCKNDTEIQQNLTNIATPMVGDPINDCMYTLITGTPSVIARINKNGTADKICNYPDNSGYFFRHIFINAESTHLIIPSNNEDTLSPLVIQPNEPKANKVYLINISTGAVSTIILTDLNSNLSHGFDKLTRRFFYTSNMASNYLKLCYVTIPSDYSSAMLSPTYYTNITASGSSKIEFIDSNNAYSVGRGLDIVKYDLSVANGSSTHIAGLQAFSQQAAGWTNNVNQWGTPTYGPYLDAPIGSNAFFSFISDICYDSENNRIIIADYGAQRIRSVDLTPGNNYAVTTLAGTSPTFLGLAINANGSTYPQSVLDTLAQVGAWGSNNMPAYTKVLGTYLSSTFNFPSKIIIFNKKIYLLTNVETKQLSNGYVTDFLVTKNYDSSVIATAFSNGGLIGSMRFVGYNVIGLTQADKDGFKLALAAQYNVNPDLINLSFAAGSLIIAFFASAVLNVNTLTLRDKTFFANAESIIRGIQPINIAACVTAANIPTSRLSITATIQIDISYTNINTSLDLVDKCKNDTEIQQNLINIFQPLVADPINDCMYTLIDGVGTNLIVVRINKNGTTDKICDYPQNSGCQEIYINSDSTYLIIPSNLNDTSSPLSIDSEPRINKVYLVNISTGVISTITLTDLKIIGGGGFDKTTRRYYYASAMALNYLKLCYVTIPADYSSAILSPNYTNINIISEFKIEFLDSTTAFMSNSTTIRKLDLSTTNGSTTFVAGPPYLVETGTWSTSTLSQGWTNGTHRAYGPYLDAPVGTNAFFSYIRDICYDSENNRLLVADYGAQRIRSVNLTPGNNYAVTTLAGTSPTTLGLAINNSLNLYSQSVLDTLAQVGLWGYNNMPAYSKVNSTYLTSTFNKPSNLLYFNKKIYLRDSTGTKQLSNVYVTDFLVTKNF
jgi:hypothetical protein